MAINILEVLGKRKSTKLNIADILKEDTGDGFIYYRLILKDVLEEVASKSKHYNGLTQRTEPYYAYDVEEVCVREDVMIEFADDLSKDIKEVDDRLEGFYEGDLFLDVSDSQKVWLDNKSLNARRRDKKENDRNNRFKRPI